MVEKTVYIIKPEALPHRQEIRLMIAEANLAITHSAVALLPEWVLVELYPDLARERNELWIATLEHLLNQECEIGIIEGENAMKKLLNLCGEETSPVACRVGTIRARFGEPIPLPAGERFYWRNAIHRPKTQEEAANDLLVANRLLKPESL